MKRYDSYKDSGVEWIGEIPNHWKCMKFTHITDNITCGYTSTPDYYDEGIMFLSSQNVKKRKLDLWKYNFISEELHSELTKHRRVVKGDILVVRVGSGIGNSCVVDIDDEFSIYVSLTHVRLKPIKYHNYFYNYVFNSPKFKEECLNITKHGGGVGNLNVKDFERFKFVVPPLSEQQQIVSFLDTKTSLIDSLIEKTQRKIELLKEKKLKLIEGVLLNPKTKRIRLEHVVDLIKRPIEREENEMYTKIGMYNWGRGIFKYPSELGSELGDSSFNYLKERDLVLSGQFSWEGSVSIVENEEDNCISSHRFHILNGKKDKILNEYLWSYFTSQEGHFILNENSPGSAGRNRPLNIGKLLKEKIPVPEIDVQMKIKRLVIETRDFEKYSKKNNELLKEYRQSLISEVVTGKRKVV